VKAFLRQNHYIRYLYVLKRNFLTEKLNSDGSKFGFCTNVSYHIR